MPHRLLLEISSSNFAIMVVVGMATTGLVLGTVVDRLLCWLGMVVDAKGDPR